MSSNDEFPATEACEVNPYASPSVAPRAETHPVATPWREGCPACRRPLPSRLLWRNEDMLGTNRCPRCFKRLKLHRGAVSIWFEYLLGVLVWCAFGIYCVARGNGVSAPVRFSILAAVCLFGIGCFFVDIAVKRRLVTASVHPQQREPPRRWKRSLLIALAAGALVGILLTAADRAGRRPKVPRSVIPRLAASAFFNHAPTLSSHVFHEIYFRDARVSTHERSPPQRTGSK
jgi:hypothetical protein